jgi:subtilisin family serine protease
MLHSRRWFQGFSGLFFVFASGLFAQVPDHVPGRLLVAPRADAEPASLVRAVRQHRATFRREIPVAGMNVLDVPEESSDAIIASLRSTGLFGYVERDFYAHTGAAPNDPSYASQWYLPVIQAPQAWDLTTGSPSVVVAVIDSGADPNHPDLAGKLVPGWSFLKGSADTSDVLGHGTAVAGTLAAASNNDVGISGVSWTSMILPVAVVDSSDFATYSNIAAAIRYAADNGARIINISLGGSNASAALQSAVDYAWSKGATIFAAAMNASSNTPYYPAACNHVVAVSATDSSDQLAAFSNYGGWITVAAPGAGILAPMAGGGYGYWYGTSFATPVAAGIAALALASNPGLANSALVDAVKLGVDDLGAAGFDNYFGWGRVNAYKTVLAAGPAPVSVSVTPSSATLNGGQSKQFTANVTNSAAGVIWSVNPAVGGIASTGLYTAPATINSTRTVTVTATSNSDSTKTASAIVTLQAPAPVITVSVTPATANLGQSQTVQFTAAVTNSASGVSWSLNPAVGTISSSGLYTAPATIATTQTVVVKATSNADSTKSASAAITLQPPAVPPPAPVTVSVSPLTTSLSASQSVQFYATVTGAGNSVTWAISPSAGSISSTGLYTAPSKIGADQVVRVTASTAGVNASASIRLLAAFQPILVNAGGAAYTDSLGQLWMGDQSYSGGTSPGVSRLVTSTNSPGLYQTARTGTFSYQFAVPSGTYQVTLCFAEIEKNGAGQRRFNVAINKSAVLSNFDIYSQAGGAFIALNKGFKVKVTNGQLIIAFTPGASGQPLVSAIQITSSGNGKTSTFSIRPATGAL